MCGGIGSGTGSANSSGPSEATCNGGRDVVAEGGARDWQHHGIHQMGCRLPRRQQLVKSAARVHPSMSTGQATGCKLTMQRRSSRHRPLPG